MIRTIALLTFAFSSLAFAGEGDVVIRCDADGSGGLERIEFIETDLTGQYVIAQTFSGAAPVMVMNSEGLWITTTESEISESATLENGVEFRMQDIWAMPTVLRMKGIGDMSAVVKDCEEVRLNLSCQRL